jgi:MYXO-CTERM domain-containing protein
VVQASSDESFTSAELAAILSPTTFMLFDGSTFTADSAALDVLLLPSSGPVLTVDVDQTTIDVSNAAATSTPEPAGAPLMLAGALGLIVWWRRRARIV